MKREKFDLRRREAIRKPVRRFYLYCEGANTEKGYFDTIARQYRTLLEIDVLGPEGIPSTLARKAISKIKEIKSSIASGKSSSFEEDDEVWVVFDRDEFDCYYSASRSCAANGVGVANSNPCFEVWLILHEQEFHKALDRHKVCKHLAKVRKDYDEKRKILNFEEIVSKIEAAEVRAGRQLQARKEEASGKVLRPPYTNVHSLTSAIRSAAKKAQRA